MDKQKIDRINALAHKAKIEGLTAQETQEQKALREEYIQAYRTNLKRQLDATIVLQPDGTTRKLRPKRNS